MVHDQFTYFLPSRAAADIYFAERHQCVGFHRNTMVDYPIASTIPTGRRKAPRIPSGLVCAAMKTQISMW